LVVRKVGINVLARIRHAAGAKDVGQAMTPTAVPIYSNPKGGTLVMPVH
jgi:uncharacterized protein (DUF302 family)